MKTTRWVLILVGSLGVMLVLMLAAAGQSAPASAINLRDDAATIAAADAAKYEVLRRQQEEARIARATEQAAIAATRVEDQRIARATEQAVEATDAQVARNVRATATEQAVISQTLALSATAAAVGLANAEATRVAQSVEAERVAQSQAAEAARIANVAAQRNAVLRQVGAVVLFAAAVALCVATVRGLWRIGANKEADKSATTNEEDEDTPPEIVIVDDPNLTAAMVEMWKQAEPK